MDDSLLNWVLCAAIVCQRNKERMSRSAKANMLKNGALELDKIGQATHGEVVEGQEESSSH